MSPVIWFGVGILGLLCFALLCIVFKISWDEMFKVDDREPEAPKQKKAGGPIDP